ncbi:hypothetical protein FACS189483_04530 [Spirochaetia bacterium]|nr:hypothetical protein FACS189483_04530 [Spirochaetia bacterium]
MSKGIGLSLVLLAFIGGLGFSQSFARGEELFLQNNPGDALPLLETAVREDPANLKASLYLAVAYIQLDQIDDAVAVYLKILPRGGAETSRIAFNLGNAYYAKGNTDQAVRYYTEAIEANSSNASAYLNRANARVSGGTLREAVQDYEFYLALEPRSAKRPQIEALISLINEEQAAVEQQRVAEEVRIQAEMVQIQAQAVRAQAEAAEDAERRATEVAVEADRRATEATAEAERRAAEVAANAERRRQLLEEVSASLQASAEDTQGMSAGSEQVLGYDDEFELE